jgi:hypothetical protein
MKSAWKVTSNVIEDKKYFSVYRLIDADAVDHSGNREYTSDYFGGRKERLTREEAQALANKLNAL